MAGKCCKCKKHDWEATYPITFTDAEGKGYCEFHAPKEGKRLGKDEFNNLIFSTIENACSHGMLCAEVPHCDLSGTVFPWPIDFSKHVNHPAFPGIELFEAEFNERCTFAGVNFLGKASFEWTVFKRMADFTNVCFNAGADFFCTEFSRQALFINCLFVCHANFLSAEFFMFANFSKARFICTTSFETAIFHHHCSFEGTEFMLRVSFKQVKIEKPCTLEKTIFRNEADMQGIACLHTESNEDIDPVKCKFILSRLDSQSLSCMIFDLDELQCLEIRNCKWPDRLGFDKYYAGGLHHLTECENLYRSLKCSSVSALDQPLVSRWHFREKLMQLKGLLLPENCNALIEAVEDTDLCNRTRARAWWELFRALPWRLRRSLPFLYWTSSGFGERATRGAVCLIVLVLLPPIFLTPLKLIETGWSLTPDSQRIAEVLLEWVRCMPFAKLDAPAPTPPTILSALRTMLSYGFQLVISLQAALFALAVRNRFRR